ncbi:hypothetical protein [Burkholderia anthina]|uniref:hypothetical protein n=1 Tax=Burkholderia anthina TaxID=179879 RepID=UPI00158EEB10|nr:hypothetical protein [Burkholderia anthina]
MLTDPAPDGDARSATPDRLRTAAWLQYLIEHLDAADTARAMAAESGDTAVAPSRAGTNLSRDALAVLHELAPWTATDGGGCACDARDPRHACMHVPDARQLAHAERRCPGSRDVFEAAHGIVDAWAFDDPDDGWTALERIATGMESGEGEAGTYGAPKPEAGGADAPPAKYLRERRAAVAAACVEPSARPGAVIDAIVLRIGGPRDEAARIDEMAALAMFSAALAAGNGVSVAAYGGRHNIVAHAIRERRTDLASVDGLLAAVSVCRLDRMLGAGSFWAYYLLAGIVIAAPDVVHAFARRFHGGAWWTWLDAVLAWPAVGRFGMQEDVAFERLRGAMSLTSRANPIVRAKRVRRRGVAVTRFSTGGESTP